MKANKLHRLISLLLAMCMLIGCLGVLPVSAAATSADGNYATVGESTSPEILQVLMNRDFEDKTTIQNGASLSSSTAINAMEKVVEGGNTFVRFTNQGAHDYLMYPLGDYAPTSGSVVLQMDVMVEDNTVNLPGIAQMNPKVRGSSSDVYQMFSITKSGGVSYLRPFNSSGSSTNSLNAGEWYTVTIVWSYTSIDSVTVTLYSGASAVATYVDNAADGAEGCTDVRPGQTRIGITNSCTGSWCMDNVVIYTTGVTDPATAASLTVASSNKGVMYNANASSYVDPDTFNGNYFMKIGVERALDSSDNQVALPAAPFTLGGTVYIPVSALEALGIAVSSSARTVNGIECVALEDIPAATGYHTLYSSMGLIGLTEHDDLTFEGLDKELLPVMKKFVFDNITSDLKNANSFSVDDMVSLSHPYIMANQERFDELAEAYRSGEDETLTKYLKHQVTQAINIYNGYASLSDGTYVGMKNDYSRMTYLDGYGYDVGGRQGDAASHNERILTLAFGYQITKNTDYARLAYDYAIALGKWEHWGPGHFLNCADASAPYALAYDWLYNVWLELGLDVTAIETVLFTHSILPAYYSAHDNGCPWYDPVVSSGWNYHTRSNNWNAVCSSGVTIASLALIGKTTKSAGTLIDIDIDGVYNPVTETYAGTTGTITRKDGKSFTTDQTGLDTYRDYCEYLVNVCLYSLPYYGLEQYVPDGSYIESNGYWSYGTNNLFEMTAALTSATGSDWGLLDAWGMDRTAYYALNTQSGDYTGWNYHDSGSTGPQDTSWYQYLGTENGLGDLALAGIRKKILNTAKNVSPSRYDAIYYMTDEEIGEFEMPALQYWMEGIDGYVVRDSWDTGSIYAAFMGNTNNLGHGQIDSGAFVYHSDGTIWFCDVGTENYNAYGFWGSGTRYTYYKMNAEGNNALVLTSQQDTLAYGQALNGFGYLTEHGDNEYGAYAIIDNTTVYGGYASYAYRGMLMTNDRRTVVIQDEVEFFTEQSAVWIGHTQQQVAISVDGTVAYMYDGENVLKVSIVDKNDSGLRFELTDTYDFLLDCTVGPTWSVDHGGVPEGDRSSYQRLIIRCDNVTSISLAVVIEEVALGETLNTDIGYEWCEMADWVPTADGRALNKEAGAFDFDSESFGSVTGAGNLTSFDELIGSNNAHVILPSSDSADSGRVIFTSNPSSVEYGSIGRGMAVIEFDLSTTAAYPTGASVGAYSNAGVLTSIPLSELGTVAASKWVRAAILLDAATSTAYYFFDGALVGSLVYEQASYENLALGFFCPAGELTEGNIIVDNIRIRIFTEDYTSLDAAIAAKDLTVWEDVTENKRSEEESTVVATITFTSSADDGDTPAVDFYSGDATVYTLAPSDGADEITVVELYSFSDIEKYLVSGATITLHGSNSYEPVVITRPCTVDTQGYEFRATSPSYIAKVSGDIIKYESGSITVNWVIDDKTTVTEVYTGSVSACYKGTLDDTITEVDNGDGSFSYYVSGSWSNTAGGAPLDTEGMVISSDNNTFYLTRDLYEGAFVTVKDGVITGYTDGAQFYTSAIWNGGYDKVSITNDFSYDSTAVSDSHSITKSLNIYLNGYTVTYMTSASSDHMFTLNGANGVLNLYGPGTVCSTATAANVVYMNNGDVYAENVTFELYRAVTDARQGFGHYKNCTVNILNGSNAFGVLNRNNAVTNTARMPRLLIDGCVINIATPSASTSVFNVQSNAALEVNGGTVVNSKGGVGTLFALINSTVGTVAGYDYANGYTYMSAEIGDMHHNLGVLYKNTSSDTSGATYDMGDRIRYVNGASFEELPGEDVAIADGMVIARFSSGTYCYIIAEEGEYATVTWRIGDRTVTEYWLDGYLPTADGTELSDLIAEIPPADGMRYTFSTRVVSADESYTFEANEISNFDIKMNLSVQSAFNINIYITKNISGVSLDSITVDGESYGVDKFDTVNIFGVDYYKFIIADITPQTSAKSYLLTLNLTTDKSVETSLTTIVSIPEYAKEVLESESATDEAKALVANILKYMESAYTYADATDSAEYLALSSMYEKYRSLSGVSVVKRVEKDLSPVTDGISGASLNLTDTPNYRFSLQDGYTGNIILTYEATDVNTGERKTLSRTFKVENGLYKGADFIEIERKAYDMALDIVITTSGGVAAYNLAAYYHSQAKELGSLTYLLNALYAYCESAELYQASLK